MKTTTNPDQSPVEQATESAGVRQRAAFLREGPGALNPREAVRRPAAA